MYSMWRVKGGRMFFWILLLAVLVSGCVSTPTSEPTEAEPPPPASKTTAFFIRDQVIVIGSAGEIDRVIEEVIKEGIELAPIEDDYDLSYLGEFQDDRQLSVDSDSFPFPPGESGRSEVALLRYPVLGQQSGLVMRLYRIANERDVEVTVRAINDAGNERNVFADPNYLTGPLAISPCGDPSATEGHPFEVGGSPFEVGGSPGAGPGAAADARGFWTQWAFGDVGVGQSLGCTGEGVRVGVFDTSPFSVDGGTKITTVSPTLTLQVSHPVMSSLLRPTTVSAVNVKDHGLFVAGLAHAVAPESEIHLIRVLNDYGCGDLYTLNKALHTFIYEMSEGQGRLDGVVMNLSLGVHQPRDTKEAGLPSDVVSLEMAVLEAYRRGAVVVAAAGNDSAGFKPQAMQLPADYPFVIGVAASNIKRGRACFSNRGNIAAPGGDGNGRACEPAVATCSEDCEYGLISLVLQSSEYPDGYAYWVGTSFSAPLVSGQAALLMGPGLLPADVTNEIRGGACPSPDPTLPNGIIDLPHALLGTPCRP